MKITKGQLKRIIAEEHAVVYGTKTKTRRPVGRRKTSKKQYVNEAKRELINEIQARAITNQLLEEGILNEFFGKMGRMAKAAFKTAKGVAGEAGAAAIKQATEAGAAVAKKAGDMASATTDFIDGMAKAGQEKVAKVAKDFVKNAQQELKDEIQKLTNDLVKQLKDAGEDDDSIKSTVAGLMPGVLGTVVAESLVGPEAQRLNEAKARKAKGARRRRR